MTMSNLSPPPRASTSSTARAPAIPFPMTTSLSLFMSRLLEHSFRRRGHDPRLKMRRSLLGAGSDFQQSDVDHERPLRAGRRCEKNLELGFRKDVLDDRERN